MSVPEATEVASSDACDDPNGESQALIGVVAIQFHPVGTVASGAKALLISGMPERITESQWQDSRRACISGWCCGLRSE